MQTTWRKTTFFSATQYRRARNLEHNIFVSISWKARLRCISISIQITLSNSSTSSRHTRTNNPQPDIHLFQPPASELYDRDRTIVIVGPFCSTSTLYLLRYLPISYPFLPSYHDGNFSSERILQKGPPHLSVHPGP